MFQIRHAQPDDVRLMADVEIASWPSALAASPEILESRLAAFPEGQLVAELNGRIIGTAYAQRIRSRVLATEQLTYDTVTDRGTLARSHDEDGDVYQLVGVGVATAGQGIGAGRLLVDRQIELARTLKGVRRIVGFTRPVRFHRHTHISIEEYVTLRSDSGRLMDPVLAFHLDSGASLVSIHSAFRPEDRESGGFGVLIEYPVDAVAFAS